jgi:hypothetical protein
MILKPPFYFMVTKNILRCILHNFTLAEPFFKSEVFWKLVISTWQPKNTCGFYKLIYIENLQYGPRKVGKILQHGVSSFTVPPKESMLWIFIALKNPLHRLGLNLWTLGLVVSTLTITPPRQLSLLCTYCNIFNRYKNGPNQYEKWLEREERMQPTVHVDFDILSATVQRSHRTQCCGEQFTNEN